MPACWAWPPIRSTGAHPTCRSARSAACATPTRRCERIARCRSATRSRRRAGSRRCDSAATTGTSMPTAGRTRTREEASSSRASTPAATSPTFCWGSRSRRPSSSARAPSTSGRRPGSSSSRTTGAPPTRSPSTRGCATNTSRRCPRPTIVSSPSTPRPDSRRPSRSRPAAPVRTRACCPTRSCIPSAPASHRASASRGVPRRGPSCAPARHQLQLERLSVDRAAARRSAAVRVHQHGPCVSEPVLPDRNSAAVCAGTRRPTHTPSIPTTGSGTCRSGTSICSVT